jgi:hypothetical protein
MRSCKTNGGEVGERWPQQKSETQGAKSEEARNYWI